MTPEETERQRVRRRILKYSVSTCLCCLIIGLLLGIALDARYRPNNILLYINSDGKVSLSPKPGDIISFAADKDPKIKVNYTKNLRPCKNKDPNDPTCIYLPFKDGPKLYLFGCTYGGANGEDNSCYDPQYGPQCSRCGSGPGGAILHPTFPPILHVGFWDVEGLLGLSSVDQALPPGQSASPEGSHSSDKRKVEGLGMTSSEPPPPRVLEYVVSCDTNEKGAIFPVGGAEPISDPITVEPYDTVTFTTYPPATDYRITGIESLCGTPTGTNPSCTVNGNASGSPDIHLAAVGCSDSTITDWSFVVQKPQ